METREFADKLGVCYSVVYNWNNNENCKLRAPTIDLLETLLAQVGDSVRAHFLATSSQRGIPEPGDHAPISGPTPRSNTVVHRELLTSYTALTTSYRLIDYTAGATEVDGDVDRHLRRLLQTEDAVPTALRGQFYDVLGDTAQLAAWLAIDRQHFPRAREYAGIALRAAAEVGDHSLHAYVHGIMAYIHLHTGHGDHAVALLDRALAITENPRRGVHPAVRSWIHEASAEAHALAGHHHEGITALCTAERLFDQVDADVPRWLAFYDCDVHIMRLKGRCLRRLRETSAAITALEQALAALPDAFVRERSGTLIDLGHAHLLCRTADPDAAATHCLDAWNLAVATKSARNQQRIRDLIPNFAVHHRRPAVRELVHLVT